MKRVIFLFFASYLFTLIGYNAFADESSKPADTLKLSCSGDVYTVTKEPKAKKTKADPATFNHTLWLKLNDEMVFDDFYQEADNLQFNEGFPINHAHNFLLSVGTDRIKVTFYRGFVPNHKESYDAWKAGDKKAWDYFEDSTKLENQIGELVIDRQAGNYTLTESMYHNNKTIYKGTCTPSKPKI